VRYPVELAAIAHGAGVPDESVMAQDVYASFGDPTPGPAPEIFSHGDDCSLPHRSRRTTSRTVYLLCLSGHASSARRAPHLQSGAMRDLSRC